MTLSSTDRNLIDIWIEDGTIPDDEYSRRYVVKVIKRLVADRDRAWGIVDTLGAQLEGSP